MASDINLIAHRYVTALFDLAKSARQLDKVKSDFITLEWVLTENRALQKFLINPVISDKQTALVVNRILETIKCCELTHKFLALLVHHKRLSIIRPVIDQYLQKLSESRNELKVQVVSAVTLSSEQTSAMSEVLAKATGKKIELRLLEDKSLIGGLQVKIGSKIFDNSISGKLSRLRIALAKAA